MSAAREVGEMLGEVGRLQGRREAMAQRRGVAVRTIRFLERRLVFELAGQELRGLRSLVPEGLGMQPFFAAATRGKHGVDSFLPIDGSEALVVGKAGRLLMARKGVPVAHWRDAADEDLSAEDLEPVVHAAREALARHLRYSAQRGRADGRLQDLCDRLAEALA